MKNTDLLKAFGEVDESLIAEAERKEIKMKKNWRTVAKVGGIAVAACLVIGIGFSAIGFGRAGSAAPKESAAPAAYDTGWNSGIKSDAGMVTAAEAPAAAPVAPMTEEAYEPAAVNDYKEKVNGEIGSIQNDLLSKKNVKLVYRADVYTQTTDFDATEKAIYEMVEKYGGYFESINKENGGYFSDGNYSYGYYTIRIPVEHYTEFLNTVGNACHIVNLNQNVEDITLQYADAEGRLETLRTKQKRLNELLAQASGMSDIIELESALADCEWEIDNYTSTLNRYDSLVGYSTISLSVEKVVNYSEGIQEDNSFFARLGRTFKRGIENVGYSIEDFIMWVSFNFVGIIIAVVVLVLVCRYFKKHPIKFRKKDDDLIE